MFGQSYVLCLVWAIQTYKPHLCWCSVFLGMEILIFLCKPYTDKCQKTFINPDFLIGIIPLKTTGEDVRNDSPTCHFAWPNLPTRLFPHVKPQKWVFKSNMYLYPTYITLTEGETIILTTNILSFLHLWLPVRLITGYTKV